MRLLGVQQIDIDYIKGNFPRDDWIRRTLYKWRDEYSGEKFQKNIDLYNKLKEMNLMDHINYFKKPTYKPVSGKVITEEMSLNLNITLNML